MNEIQKKIEKAYRLVSAIGVSGDAVDVMAAARCRLKEAFETAGDKSALWDAHKQADKPAKEKEEADG